MIEQAVVIAKRLEATTSYVVGEFWTNGALALRLSQPRITPALLEINCSHAESGCGCDCEACNDCIDATPSCESLSMCRKLTVAWHEDRPVPVKSLGQLLQAAEAKGRPLRIGKRAGAWPVGYCCVLLPETSGHLQLPLSNGQAHANALYLAEVRRAWKAVAWHYVLLEERRPLMAACRDGQLVAMLMPLVKSEQCRMAA